MVWNSGCGRVWQRELRIPAERDSDDDRPSAAIALISRTAGRPFAFYAEGEYYHNFPASDLETQSLAEGAVAMTFEWSDVFDLQQFLSELARIGVATLLGGLIGLERQINGHWAGLRTHIAVALGAAVFTLVGLGLAPLPSPDGTRVVQGIAAGIGFLGAGTILKLSDQKEVKGLTTASSIWLTAAVGTAAGLAMFSLAVSTTVVTLIVLALLRPLEKRFPDKSD